MCVAGTYGQEYTVFQHVLGKDFSLEENFQIMLESAAYGPQLPHNRIDVALLLGWQIE